MPFELVIFTSISIMILAILGTFTAYFYFMRLGGDPTDKKKSLLIIGFIVGVFLIACFLFWLLGHTSIIFS